MPHWVIEHTTKVIIGFLVPLVLAGGGYIVWYASKVPKMEETLAKHDDKLATISANVILLMNKSGEKLDEGKVKELISQVKDIGRSKARLVSSAKVIKGTGEIPIIEWVPPESKASFEVLRTTATSLVKDNKSIGKLISATAVAEEGATWAVIGDALFVSYPSGEIAFTPNKGIDKEELEKTADEMNAFSKELSQVKIEEVKEVEQKL